jgi:hypothetical protein
MSDILLVISLFGSGLLTGAAVVILIALLVGQPPDDDDGYDARYAENEKRARELR